MRWTPNQIREAWQNASLHRFGECGILGNPAQTTQFRVADTFVAIPAFALLFRFPDWRQRPIQPLRQPAVTFALLNRFIVDDVKNLGGLGFSIQQKEERGRGVISMDLIYKAIILRIDDRLARQEFCQ